MAGTTTHPTGIRSSVCDFIVDKLDVGSPSEARLVFRTSGNANSPGTAVANLRMSNPAFGAAASGIATANAIASDTNAAGGTIATATLQTGSGDVIIHCTVGTSGDAINITSGGLSVTAGDTVSCSSLTYEAMP